MTSEYPEDSYGPPEPAGFIVPVVSLSRVGPWAAITSRMPCETPSGTHTWNIVRALKTRHTVYHLLPGENTLWMDMQTGDIVGIIL